MQTSAICTARLLPKNVFQILCISTHPPMPVCTLSLHAALPISAGPAHLRRPQLLGGGGADGGDDGGHVHHHQHHRHRRSEEHTSELQSRGQLVCRLLLEKKK